MRRSNNRMRSQEKGLAHLIDVVIFKVTGKRWHLVTRVRPGIGGKPGIGSPSAQRAVVGMTNPPGDAAPGTAGQPWNPGPDSSKGLRRLR